MRTFFLLLPFVMWAGFLFADPQACTSNILEKNGLDFLAGKDVRQVARVHSVANGTVGFAYVGDCSVKFFNRTNGKHYSKLPAGYQELNETLPACTGSNVFFKEIALVQSAQQQEPAEARAIASISDPWPKKMWFPIEVVCSNLESKM